MFFACMSGGFREYFYEHYDQEREDDLVPQRNHQVAFGWNHLISWLVNFDSDIEKMKFKNCEIIHMEREGPNWDHAYPVNDVWGGERVEPLI